MIAMPSVFVMHTMRCAAVVLLFRAAGTFGIAGMPA